MGLRLPAVYLGMPGLGLGPLRWVWGPLRWISGPLGCDLGIVKQVWGLLRCCLKPCGSDGGSELDSDPSGLEEPPPPRGGAGPDRFSSGMCRAIMISGSWHCTAQPRRSPARRVSTCRKWLGMRLHEMGISICTSSLGGHCGAGFLHSLRNMAADSGMIFWGHGARVRIPNPLSCHTAPKEIARLPLPFGHSASLASRTSRLSMLHHCTRTFCFPSSNWMTFWLVGRTKTAGKSFVLGSTWQGRRGQGEEGELDVVLTLEPKLWGSSPHPDPAGV